jgi:trimeric autotransporter adhesin
MSSGFGRSLPVNSLNGSSSSVSFKQSQNIPPGSASRANLAPPATNSVSLQGGLSAASTTSFSSSFSGGSSLSSSSTSLSASAVLSSSALGSLRNSSQNPLAERPASTGNAMPAFKIPKLKVQSNTATNSQISQAQTVPASSASSLLLQGASSSQRSIATNLSRSSVTTSITAMTAKVNNELTSSSVFSTSRLEPTQSTFQITSSSFSSSSFSTASSSTSLSLAPIRSQQQQQHQSYTKSNFGSAQPSFVIAEDEDGALSTTTSPIQSFSFSSSFVPSSSTLSSASSSSSSSEATSAVDDVPLQLSELNNVAYTSASSAPPPPPPPSSSSLSAAIIDTVPPMTTISKSSASFLPAFQLPTRTQIKTGSSASASVTALSNNSASIKPRGRRKSGANTAILSVTDPIGVADILDHPALPVSDSEDDEQELRLTASKKRKASSSSSSTVLALNTSEVDSSSAAIVSVAIDHHSMIIDPQPSTSSRSRRKSSSSSASTVGSGSGMTGTNEVLPLTTTSEATGGSRKRTRGSQKQSTPTTLVNETTFNVSRDDVSISLSSS